MGVSCAVAEYFAATGSFFQRTPPNPRRKRLMAGKCVVTEPLMLKRASASRPSGQWSDDDFDVLAHGAVVGRIFKVHAAPVGSPWMWTLAFGYQEDRTPTHPLRCDPRGRDGSVREELAAGVE